MFRGVPGTQENEIHGKPKKEIAEHPGPGGLERLKKWLTIKTLVILLVSLLFILAGVVALWFFFLKGPDNGKVQEPVQPTQVEAVQETVQPTQVEAVQETPGGYEAPRFEDVVVLETFERIVLKPSGNMKLITLDIAFELLDPGMKQEIEANMSSIRKIIEAETGEMTWLVLRTPEGKLQLKLKLIRVINQTLTRAKIRDLFFNNLIMQN
ncbi:MAG: flagellar basal body-associated FliL family protein [Desulfobacterium sp.]|nr:flagellar basal body-associated FliL family protein [Desulfobacterium sp.]